jgi:hypothetical protein
MSIYNQIKDKFIMKNAWQDWTSYRNKLTDIILDEKPESVMLVGAGRCNDIDLKRILSAAEKVICIDIDEEAMHFLKSDMPQELLQKFDYRILSLTGITEADIEAFCDDILGFARAEGMELTLDKMKVRIVSGLENLKGRMIQDSEELLRRFPPEKYELIVCCGVCSQFFSTISFFIRSIINSLQDIIPDIDCLNPEIHDIIHGMNDHLIPIINSTFYSYAGKTIILGNEYNPESPVEGAYQCITDAREHMNPDEKHIKWDFNPSEGIIYDMLIQISSKIQ